MVWRKKAILVSGSGFASFLNFFWYKFSHFWVCQTFGKLAHMQKPQPTQFWTDSPGAWPAVAVSEPRILEPRLLSRQQTPDVCFCSMSFLNITKKGVDETIILGPWKCCLSLRNNGETKTSQTVWCWWQNWKKITWESKFLPRRSCVPFKA